MSINLVVPSYLLQYTDNNEEIEVDGGTVDECLKYLVRQYPPIRDILYDKNGKLHSYVGIYVNGEDIYPDEQGRAVRNGDKINVIYMITGG
jgi:molybdopterin converting factor small subunit